MRINGEIRGEVDGKIDGFIGYGNDGKVPIGSLTGEFIDCWFEGLIDGYFRITSSIWIPYRGVVGRTRFAEYFKGNLAGHYQGTFNGLFNGSFDGTLNGARVLEAHSVDLFVRLVLERSETEQDDANLDEIERAIDEEIDWTIAEELYVM